QYVYQFNTNQGELSRLKRLEPEHRTCHPLHSSMILLNDLKQRFHLTDHGSGAVLLVVALDGCCSGLAAINRDRLGTPFRRIAFFRNRNTASLSRRAVSKQSIVWPCLSTTRDKYRHSPFLYNPFFSPQKPGNNDSTQGSGTLLRCPLCDNRRLKKHRTFCQ